MPMKCPFCKSENTERISGYSTITKKIPERNVTSGGTTCTYSAYALTLATQRYLCLECGGVFERLSESDLKRYKEA